MKTETRNTFITILASVILASFAANASIANVLGNTNGKLDILMSNQQHISDQMQILDDKVDEVVIDVNTLKIKENL